MDINLLIDKIIPPAEYKYRNGFSNHKFIDDLSQIEKGHLENILIVKLKENSSDTLIVETLAYLKSMKSIPILYELLNSDSNLDSKLVIATCIYEINMDSTMIDIAISTFNNIEKKEDAYTNYSLIQAFYYLVKFNSKRLNLILEEYSSHKNYLLSFNANQALNKNANR